jgi:membrane associated rhomboid family serine protease
MISSIWFVDKVGVGASGSILGILSAWIVWIAFRWNKVPERYRSQRNCQMMVVVAAVVLTLGKPYRITQFTLCRFYCCYYPATSFAPYVDWAVHFGGTIQGLLWGVILLGKELDNPNTRVSNRVTCLAFLIDNFCFCSVFPPIQRLHHFCCHHQLHCVLYQ